MSTKNIIAIEVSQDEHYKTQFLKSLKEDWPALAKDFRHYCHQENPKTGDVWLWTSPDGVKYVHMIMDKENGDKHLEQSRLAAFKKCLKAAHRVLSQEEFQLLQLKPEAFLFSEHELKQAQELLQAM